MALNRVHHSAVSKASLEACLPVQQNRTLVCYKKRAYELDPFASHPDPLQRRRTTTQFRMNPVNRPENELIGVTMYADQFGEKLASSVDIHLVLPKPEGMSVLSGRLKALLNPTDEPPALS